jgi:phosphatidylglycerophosphate synthase
MEVDIRRRPLNPATALTLSRLVLGFAAVALATAGTRAMTWAALALFLTSGILDIFDGALARRLGCTTPFGAFLDALIDKLVLTAFVAWLLRESMIGLGFAVAAISRDVVLQGLRGYASSAGVELKRYTVSHVAFILFHVAVACALIGRAEGLQPFAAAVPYCFAVALVFAYATFFAISAADWRAIVFTSYEKESIA